MTPQEQAHIDWQTTRANAAGYTHTEWQEWLADKANTRVTDVTTLADETGQGFNLVCAELLAVLTAYVSVPEPEWVYALEVARIRLGGQDA